MARDLDDQNIWCEKCRIPMVFTHHEEMKPGTFCYECHACQNRRTVRFDDLGKIVVERPS